MDKYARQLVVSDLLPETTKDDLELSFESERVYPSPGTVMDVEMNPDGATAIITFEEEEVVKRLVQLRKVTINANGQQRQVTCSPQTRLKPSPKPPSKPTSKPVPKPRTSLTPDRQVVAPKSFVTNASSTPNSVYKEDNNSCNAHDYRNSSPSNFGDCHWWGTDENSQQSQQCPSQKYDNDSDNKRFSDPYEDMTTQSGVAKIPEEDNDSYSSCRSNTDDTEENPIIQTENATVALASLPVQPTEDDSRTPSENIVISPPQPSAVHSVKPSDSELESASITFSPEKVRLLAKLAASEKVRFTCKVETQCNSNDIIITGTSEEVMKTKIEVYEILSKTSTGTVIISERVVQLLQSDRGDRWLNEQLAERHLVAVFYIERKSPTVIAADGDTLRDTRNWFKDAFMSETMQVESYHRKFLETSECSSTIKRLIKSSALLEIKNNPADLTVVIDGLKADVAVAQSELNQLIQKRSKIDHEVKLKPGVYRVLHKSQYDIKDGISRLEEDLLSDGKIGVKFDEASQKIILHGSSDDVAVAEKYIQSEFVSKVYHDTVEICLPGLTVNDFASTSNKGNEIIDVIQTKHHCFIEVAAGTNKDSASSGTKSFRHEVPSPSSSVSNHKIVPSSPPKLLSSAIKVVKGNLPDFQEADVLVNAIASKTPKLESAGAVAVAFLKATGTELQQQLEKNWPQKFGRDIVRLSACGQIKAKKIYNIAIRKYGHGSSRLLEDAVALCLDAAVKDQMSSIAFPTMGCGKLGFDPQLVVECFVRAEHRCKSNIRIFVVAFEDSLKQKFESGLLSVTSAEDPTPTIVSTIVTSPQETSPTTVYDSSSFEVRQGSLTDFKADVLVNLITNDSKNLTKSGIVAQSFLKAGGPELQQEFDTQPFPKKFGEDFAITKATGNLQATSIYHVAVRKYDGEQSEQRLCDTIGICLKKAVRDKMMTIAFPTVGCGKLGFDPALVARCFLRAKQDSGALIKVFIIAFEDSLRKTFSDVIFAKATTVAAPPTDMSTPERRTSQPSFEPMLIFHINTLDKSSVDEVKKQLEQKVTELIGTNSRTDDVVEHLSMEYEMEIHNLQSDNVRITIDKHNKCVVMKGKKELLRDTKKKVIGILKRQKEVLDSPEHIKKTKGVTEYLRVFGCRETTDFPPYWSSYASDNPSGKTKQTELDKKSEVYKDVEKIIVGTWDAGKAGHGNDAAGLSHSAIAVRKIWQLEEGNMFRKYDVSRKNLCKKASVIRIPGIEGLKAEWEVKTRKLGLKELDKVNNLVSEINECYLLHGTRKNFVDCIAGGGLDFRMAGKSTGTMFGNGTYLAESSTKADQYTDEKSKRVGPNQPLYMFVVRTLLGNAFVCQKPQKFMRPPCSVDTCLKDDCSDNTHIGLSFDSVIGTHKDSTTRLIFREFVIFDLSLCYPEFLVEYERH